MAKSFGRKYVEFAAVESCPVKLALYGHRALTNDLRVPADGTGSHRLALGSTAGPFTDPDGFAWELPAPLLTPWSPCALHRDRKGECAEGRENLCAAPAAKCGFDSDGGLAQGVGLRSGHRPPLRASASA